MKGINKTKKGCMAILSCALVLPLLSLPSTNAALGIETTESTGRTCSLTLTDGSEYTDLKAVEIPVELYKVATVDVSGNYTLTSDFTGLTLPDQTADKAVIDEQWKDTAEDAAALADGKTADSEMTLLNGTATVDSLSTGLYLIVPETVIGEGAINEYSFAPSLISLPNNYYASTGNDDWVYDVEAALKPEQTVLTGSLVIQKNLTEFNQSLSDAMFVFQVEATKTDTQGVETSVYSNTVALTFNANTGGSQSVQIDDIPAGAQVTVTEVYAGASYELANGDANTKTTTIASKELVESGKAVTAEVTFTNSYNDKLVPSYGIVNHFEYDEEADDWTWTQQGIEVVPDVQTN